MDTFFGVPWASLDLDGPARFLSDQEDEGLTWETKGTEIRPTSVLKAVCGLANQLGGFLIIGASRGDDGEWTLPVFLFLMSAQRLPAVQTEPHELPAFPTWLVELQKRAGARPTLVFRSRLAENA